MFGTFAFFVSIMSFGELLSTVGLLITISTPVGIFFAALIDYLKHFSIRRTLPRFLIALASFPLLVFLCLWCAFLAEERFRDELGFGDFGVNEKIFFTLILIAYFFCNLGLVAFVAQKLPFLKQAFNPVEENIPSIITTK